VMIGRSAVAPLPEALQSRLDPVGDVAAAIDEFIRASGIALLARRLPPGLDAVESALDSYASAIAAVRNDGLTRCLPVEVTERFFALSFALEQMRPNLRDLHRCVTECVQPAGRISGAPPRTHHMRTMI
jgi:hypothetical protein